MKLFWFETYKTFSRWRTYISFVAIALIVILTEVVMKLSAGEILDRLDGVEILAAVPSAFMSSSALSNLADSSVSLLRVPTP